MNTIHSCSHLCALPACVAQREAERTVMDDQRYCRQMLDELQRGYALAAKPYIERLVKINSLRPEPGIVLTPEQAREFAGDRAERTVNPQPAPTDIKIQVAAELERIAAEAPISGNRLAQARVLLAARNLRAEADSQSNRAHGIGESK